MEEKAGELLGAEVLPGGPRPSVRGASSLVQEDRSPFAAGPSVAAVLDVASALESKLEVCLWS